MYKILKNIFRLDKLKYHVINLMLLCVIVFLLFFDQVAIWILENPGSIFEFNADYNFSGIGIITNYQYYKGPAASSISPHLLFFIIMLLISSFLTLVVSVIFIFKKEKLKIKYQIIIGAFLFVLITAYWIVFIDEYVSLLSYIIVVVMTYIVSLVFLSSDFIYRIFVKFKQDYNEDKYQKKHYVVGWTENIVNVQVQRNKVFFSTKKLKKKVARLQKEEIDFNIVEKN